MYSFESSDFFLLADKSRDDVYRYLLNSAPHHIGGQSGRLSDVVTTYKPAFGKMENALGNKFWHQISEDLDRYNAIRAIYPEFPELRIERFVTTCEFVGVTDKKDTYSFASDDEFKAYSVMLALYGLDTAAHWRQGSIFYKPQYERFIRLRSGSNYMSRTRAQKMLNESVIVHNTAFLSENDAAIVALAAPKAIMYDVRYSVGKR